MVQKFFLNFQHRFPPGVTVTSHKPRLPKEKKKHCNISFLVYFPLNSLGEQIVTVTWVFRFLTWISGILQEESILWALEAEL